MPVEVFVADEQSDLPIDCERWAALARAALGAQGVRGDAELSLLFVDEPTIAALAQRFLGHQGPTDVLSFPIEDEIVTSGRSPDAGGTGPGWEPPDPDALPVLLGDVVVCPAVAGRNAPDHAGPDHAGSLDDEIALLVVHGILHLLGMDHEEPAEAERMEAREQELLGAHYRTEEAGTSGAREPAGAEGATVKDEPAGAEGAER